MALWRMIITLLKKTEPKPCTRHCVILLYIRYPIIQAGMSGGIATSELIAAVSNAGGLGVLGAGRI